MAPTKRDELAILSTAGASPICKITFCKRKGSFAYLCILQSRRRHCTASYWMLSCS